MAASAEGLTVLQPQGKRVGAPEVSSLEIDYDYEPDDGGFGLCNPGS